MRPTRAVIEVGTNSIKFCLPGTPDEIDIARLGENLGRTGEIGAQVIERNARVVERFVKIAREAKVKDIIVVGTMALRTATDADVFRARVRKLCGLDVRVLSGSEEARLAFKAAVGVVGEENKRNYTIFDTGGGSTEIIYGRENEIVGKFSVNVGTLNAGEDIEKIVHKFKIAGIIAQEGLLVGAGGTVTAMASVKLALPKYRPEAVNGLILTGDDVESQINLYSSLPVEERKKIVGLSAKRADIILSGAMIVRALMTCLDKTEFTVSNAGVRHALISGM